MTYLILTLTVSFLTVAAEYFWKDGKVVLIAYGLINPFLAFIPRIFIKFSSRFRNSIGNGWLRKMEFHIFLAMLINAPGSLFFHGVAPQYEYDRFLHFAGGIFLPVLSLGILIPVLKMYGINIRRTKVIWFGFFAITAGLFVFEFYQFSVDKIFGTHLFWDGAQPIQNDFTEDIVFGFIGMLIGLARMRKSDLSWLKI